MLCDRSSFARHKKLRANNNDGIIIEDNGPKSTVMAGAHVPKLLPTSGPTILSTHTTTSADNTSLTTEPTVNNAKSTTLPTTVNSADVVIPANNGTPTNVPASSNGAPLHVDSYAPNPVANTSQNAFEKVLNELIETTYYDGGTGGNPDEDISMGAEEGTTVRVQE